MAQYRKKPVEIEAMQWLGGPDCFRQIKAFAGAAVICWFYNHETLCIATLEGEMTASVGDWIIKGVKGEFYPCKPDIFAMTYEEV